MSINRYPINQCYLEHCNVTTKDIEKTKNFFLTAFPHWRVRGRGKTKEPNVREWMHVGDDQFYVALEAARETEKDARNRRPYYHFGINHAGFAVKESVDSIKKRLIQGGFKEGFTAEKHEFRQRVYFFDGTGNEFEFVEYFSRKPSERNLYPPSAVAAANATSIPAIIKNKSNQLSNESNQSNQTKSAKKWFHKLDLMIDQIDKCQDEMKNKDKNKETEEEKKNETESKEVVVMTEKTEKTEKNGKGKPKLKLSDLDQLKILPSMRVSNNSKNKPAMYNDKSNPMDIRRNHAIKVIYQFLEEEGLHSTLKALNNETGVNEVGLESQLKTGGILLESIDLRDAYFSAQNRSKDGQKDLTKLLEGRALDGKNEQAFVNEVCTYSNFIKSNLLCLSIFYDNIEGKPYLLFGVASRTLYIISLDTVFGNNSKDKNKEKAEEEGEDESKIEEQNKNIKPVFIGELNGLKGPPLYINISQNRYALVCCMDGSCYVIDLEYTIVHYIEDKKNKNENYGNGYWRYEHLRSHNKYVVMGKWCKDGKYCVTGSHDHSMNLFFFRDDYATVSMSRNDKTLESKFLKLKHCYKYDGCVEAMEWIDMIKNENTNTNENKNTNDNDCKKQEKQEKQEEDNYYEFVVAIRGNNYLHYYRMDKMNINTKDWQLRRKYNFHSPYIKCNINPFGDDHISYSIGDLKISNDGKFLLAKTDQEKVLLFECESENILRIYYGSHSDLYTYTRCFFSPMNKYIYASHHNSFVVWDIVTGKIVDKINAHKNTLRDMIIDEKSGHLISISFDKTIKIFK